MFIKTIKFFFILTLFICTSASSVEPEPEPEPEPAPIPTPEPNNSEYINPLQKPSYVQENDLKKQSKTSKSDTIEVNENDLLNNVGLLERALIQSIINENIKAINILLPIYVKVENKNKLLYLRALALQETSNNKISKSIELYKEILKIDPYSIKDQFKLAQNYYFNYQNSEAINALIKIKERDNLTVDTSFNFIRDNNVNQAPDKNNRSNIPIYAYNNFNAFISIDKRF